MPTIILLIISNVFMTCAWYGHLKFKQFPLWQVILLSWLIALPEYIFQVPANRIGHAGGVGPGAIEGSGPFTAAQLKTIQEVITLVVFCAFSVLYLKEPLKWNYLVGFALIGGGVFVIFRKW